TRCRSSWHAPINFVMAGYSSLPCADCVNLSALPAIHGLTSSKKDVDARHKAGHDGVILASAHTHLLSQPFDQRRRMHLVGLVVSGQRVHHDVDASAEGEFALPRFARRKRQHWLAVGAYRPGAGKVVGSDDDRR